MHFDARDPLLPSDGGLSSGPARDGLLEQLRAGLMALEPNCRPQPRIVQQRLLWFYQDEYRAVNSVWQNRGIHGVINEWGDSRTYAAGSKVDVWSTPPQEDPAILWILDYESNQSEKSLRSAKVRTATLTPSIEQRQWILESLSCSGLLQRFVPVVDMVTGAVLRSSAINRVACHVKWHAEQKGRHEETRLAICLEILPLGCSPEFFTLVIDGSGSVRCSIKAAYTVEAGYEQPGYQGHINQTFELSSGELRALLPIVGFMAELPATKDTRFVEGQWIGLTLKQF